MAPTYLPGGLKAGSGQFVLFHHPERDLNRFDEAFRQENIRRVMINSLEEIPHQPDMLGVILLDDSLLGSTPKFPSNQIPGFSFNTRFLALETPYVLENFPVDRVHIFLGTPLSDHGFLKALRTTYLNIYQVHHTRAVEDELRNKIENLQVLNEIGVALSTEHNYGALLEMILTKARELVNCDAGSLYLLEDDEDGDGQRLRFKLTQNDSISAPWQEFTLPVSDTSLAGNVAMTGEPLNLPDVYEIEDLPITFNKAFDQQFGYRTKSMLVLPMQDHQERMIGVLQLINPKVTRPPIPLTLENTLGEVQPFEESQVLLLKSLASQAAVCLENNILYENIQKLFEGFVTASVTAIEQRDPTTSGHSSRVATYTVKLAELADNMTDGPFADASFTREHLRELRYASLLHDFGKVGVRENVLVKAKKLYPDELAIMHRRFEYIDRTVRWQYQKTRADGLAQGMPQGGQEQAKMAMDRHLETLWKLWDTVTTSNEPTVLPEGEFQMLSEISAMSYMGHEGKDIPYMLPNEVEILSIRKGSLTPKERLEIESHVTHTFHFLSKIPWTQDLKNVPSIAYAHHEKLNGRGYPRGLAASEIPLQARMMTVSDIFDALAARDRPYKRALPTEKALDILGYEAKDGMLDDEVVKLFVEGKIFEAVKN